MNENPSSKKKRLTHGMKLFLTFVVGIVTLIAGIGMLVYNYMVNMEVPYFAIPLVMCIPVIVAVTFNVLINQDKE